VLTVVLHTTSNEVDASKYSKILNDKDKLVIISDEKSVEACNEAIRNSVELSDILLLSDQIEIYDGFIENMTQSLYATEKHAIACGQEIEADLINTVAKYLPMYSRTIKPTANCALIKRSIIDNLGVFDAVYESLQYALMDYYLRINDFGYTAITAHHAMFSASQAMKKSPQISDDEKLFNKRYEYFQRMEQHFNQAELHPCLKFLDLLDNESGQRKKILFDCIIMPPFCNGTSEYQISMFDAFCRLYGNKYDIYMYVNREADEYHKLSKRYKNVLLPDTIGDSTFHLGFVPNQMYFMENQIEMNKRCLKVVQTVLDIIALRCYEHQTGEMQYNNIIRVGFKLCDGIVTISKYSMHDLKAYFSDDSELERIPVKPILIASQALTPLQKKYKLPFDDYFLVVGNSFKHKAMKEAVCALGKTLHNFIFVGYGNNEYFGDNIYGYQNGYLEDDFLSYLYASCKALIFPSLYEGFGLPIVIALRNNKRVIVSNTEINHELQDYLTDFHEHFMLFDRFEQIDELISSTDFSVGLSPVMYKDSWERVAAETEIFFEQILNTEIDVNRLYERRNLYNFIEAKLCSPIIRTVINSASGHKQPLLKRLKERLRRKHPRFFGFLKKIRATFLRG